MTNNPLKMAGVCGWPIHHSLSPILHQYWLQKGGIKGAYIPFAVRPDDAMRAFKSLPRTSIRGVNVTLPLKQIAFEAADILSPDARKLGAVNCLYHKEGVLYGHNTDLEGFAQPLLKALGPNRIMREPALVLGTGGAARAVVGALLSLNCPEIRLCGRSRDKAVAIVSEVNVPSLYDVSWKQRETALASAGLVINATSGGMAGKDALDMDLSGAAPGTFVYDLIYTPYMTPFLKQAKSQGLPFLSGLDMLIGQARPAFKLFFGKDAPADDPTRLLLKALGQEPAEGLNK